MRKIVFLVLFLLLNCPFQTWATQGNGSLIKGRVTDINGTALAGAGITIDNTFMGVHADRDGNYNISRLKDGVYRVRFSFVGYETQVHEVILESELVLNVTLSDKPLLTDEVIVYATRAGEHSPLAYSSIDNAELKKQNIGLDMPYILSLTPSLVETSEAGNGVGYTGLRIRGTDGNRINVTIDGIPLNDPESQQVFWVDLPDLASSVENIQIQRGAGTSSNGAGAFGATINIQTISPENEPFAEVSSSVGSFGTIKNMVSAGTGFLDGKFALRMRLSELKSNGYIERTGSEHRSAFITGAYRTGRSLIKANIILGEEHTGIGWWGVPKDSLATNRRYNPSGEYTDQHGITRYYNNESDNYLQNHLQLIYSLKISDNLSFHSALHYTRGKGYYEEYREDQLFTDYGLTPIIIADSVISSTDLIRRKWMSNDFYGLVYSVKYQKNRIEAVAGGGTNLYLGDHFGRVIWMRNSGNSEKDYRWYLNRSRKGEFSIYGKINYSLSEEISVFGDLQYRYVRYELDGPDDDLKYIGQEHNFGFFNPKGGIFISVAPDQDAYFSISVANREPTRSDYKEASGDHSATPKSEKLYDSEIGYKISSGNSSFAVNLYGMIYRDQLVPTGELSNVGYSIMTNVDKSYRLGLELSSGIIFSDNISWNMNLTVSRNKIVNFVEHYTDYNTTDWSSEYLSKNLGLVDIAYSPPVTGTSDLKLNIFRNVDFHLISKYVGHQYFDNTMNQERSIDPYFINSIRIDLSPEIRNIKGFECSLLLNNILNEVYESNAYGGNWYENGTERTWSYYFPQAGTNFIIKAGIKF